MKLWLVVLRAVGGLLISAAAIAAAYRETKYEKRRY